jgi:hypothetical protein
MTPTTRMFHNPYTSTHGNDDGEDENDEEEEYYEDEDEYAEEGIPSSIHTLLLKF